MDKVSHLPPKTIFLQYSFIFREAFYIALNFILGTPDQNNGEDGEKKFQLGRN